MSKAAQQPPHASGHALSILILIIPIAELIWIFSTGVRLPANHVALLREASLAAVCLFIPMWLISFWKTRKDRQLAAVTAFTFVLWFIAGIFTYAKVNIDFDDGPTTEVLVKVADTYKSSGPKAPSCSLTLDGEVAGTKLIHVKRDYCDRIRPGTDGVKLKLRSGRLSLPWVEEVTIVLDFDLYRQRLKI